MVGIKLILLSKTSRLTTRGPSPKLVGAITHVRKQRGRKSGIQDSVFAVSRDISADISIVVCNVRPCSLSSTPHCR